jgi:hypothetical protein
MAENIFLGNKMNERKIIFWVLMVFFIIAGGITFTGVVFHIFKIREIEITFLEPIFSVIVQVISGFGMLLTRYKWQKDADSKQLYYKVIIPENIVKVHGENNIVNTSVSIRYLKNNEPRAIENATIFSKMANGNKTECYFQCSIPPEIMNLHMFFKVFTAFYQTTITSDPEIKLTDLHPNFNFVKK